MCYRGAGSIDRGGGEGADRAIKSERLINQNREDGTAMRPEAREMTQHRVPLENGRSMPRSLTDSNACPGLELPRCKLLANPAAFAYVVVLYVHKTPS